MSYLSAATAARLTGVSERTVRRWAAAGRVRSIRRGHGYLVWFPEVAAIAGHADPAVQAPDAAMSDRPATAELSASAAIEAGHLAALVRDLHVELLRRSEAAAMWQARAEMLGHQLRALEAPRPHQTATAVRETAEAPDPPSEPSELIPAASPVPQPIPPEPNGGSPWWRRWWAALSVP